METQEAPEAKTAAAPTANPQKIEATTPSQKPSSPTYSLDDAIANEGYLRGAAEKAKVLNQQRAKSSSPLVFSMPKVERFTADPGDVEFRQRRQRAWDMANIPARYRQADLNKLIAVPGDIFNNYHGAVGLVKTLLDKAGMYVLLGNRGSGKTWMACALAKEFCRQGRLAIYLEAMDFFIALQETYGEGKANPSDIERKYEKPELLILDAMEERGDTAWSDRMLTRLINKRYSAQKSTLLISNEREELFNKRVGESIVDRIRDEGGKIECNWPSLRGRVGGGT